MLENFRDAEHERAVHAFLLEYLVDVGARAAQLPCEPGDGAALFAERFLQEFSEMDFHERHVPSQPVLCGCIVLAFRCGGYKKRGPLHCSSLLSGLRIAHPK